MINSAKSPFPISLPAVAMDESYGRYALKLWSGDFCRFDVHHTNHAHRHETYHELCIVISGYGEFKHGHQRVKLAPGTLFFSEKNVPHEISSLTSRNLYLVFFCCEIRTTPAALSSNPFDSVIHRFLLGHAQAMDRCGELLSYVQIIGNPGERSFDRARRQRAMELLIVDAFDRLSFQKSAEKTGSESTSTIVSRVLAFIESNSLRPVTIAEVALAGGCSARHVRRVFKGAMGKSIVETINERKMVLGAQKLLMGFSVTQVAEVLHMSSIARFSRLFKRHFGMAPKVYQRLNAPRLSVPQTTFIIKR